MKKSTTKVTELPKKQQKTVNISLDLSMAHGEVKTQKGMALAMNIANTEFYKMIKEQALYKYVFSSEIGDFTIDWCSYCELIIKKSETEVDRMFLELPQMEAEFNVLFKDDVSMDCILKKIRNKQAIFFKNLISTVQQ